MRTLLPLLLAAATTFSVRAQAPERLTELTALEYDFMDIRIAASMSGVAVTWLALDTTGLEAYEVQRADEYGDWSTVYRLPARRALILLEETWEDPQPITGMNAYRVARILRDEEPHYSEVRFLTYFGRQGVRLFPNPVRTGSPVYLEFIGPPLDEFALQLIDDKGKIISRDEFTGTGEGEQVSIIVDAPSGGNYLVQMLYEDVPVESWALQVR